MWLICLELCCCQGHQDVLDFTLQCYVVTGVPDPLLGWCEWLNYKTDCTRFTLVFSAGHLQYDPHINNRCEQGLRVKQAVTVPLRWKCLNGLCSDWLPWIVPVSKSSLDWNTLNFFVNGSLWNKWGLNRWTYVWEDWGVNEMLQCCYIKLFSQED